MTVSIGGVALNDSLYLSGIENAKRIAVSKSSHFTGTTTVQVMVMSDNKPLTLGTVTDDGSTTGIWCQWQIDQIKSIEGSGTAVMLTYRDRGNFNVLLTGTAFKQFNQREPVGPNKKYTGSISMEMV